MTTDSFAAFVKSQQPSPKEKKDEVLLEILISEMPGSTACVRVRDAYLGMIFLDTLFLLKVGDDWLIYSNLFHVES